MAVPCAWQESWKAQAIGQTQGRHRAGNTIFFRPGGHGQIGWYMLYVDLISLSIYIHPLVMTNIAMVKPWPIKIDGLPIKLNMVIFHRYVK